MCEICEMIQSADKQRGDAIKKTAAEWRSFVDSIADLILESVEASNRLAVEWGIEFQRIGGVDPQVGLLFRMASLGMTTLIARSRELEEIKQRASESAMAN